MSEQSPPTPEKARIAELNDEFRRAGPAGGTWLVTPGVQQLPDVPGLITAVRQFDTFTEENDPFGEHDFGTIGWHEEKVLWKIDYYDPALKYFMDALSPECRRVMTVMRADEY